MPAGALAAGLPRQDHLYTITHESFRFHNKNFDEMRCKLDSTENLRSFKKYLTPHWSTSFPSSTFGCGRWIQIFWVANTWIDLKREIMYTLHFPNFCGGRDDFPTLNRNASAANLIQIRPATSIERKPPPLTSGKVAKLNKLTLAYQLANIPIFCTGQGISIYIHPILIDSRWIQWRTLETRNNGLLDLKSSKNWWTSRAR